MINNLSTYKMLNNCFRLLILIFIVFLLVAKTGFSQSLEFPKTIETYIGGTILFDIKNEQEPVGSSGNFQGNNTNEKNSLMLRWGYREESTYAIELGYINVLKTNAKSNNNYQTQHSFQGVFADLFLFFPLYSQLSIYGKIGTMYGEVNSTLYIPNQSRTNAIDNNWGSSVGFGVEYLINPAFAIRGGWESTKIKNDTTSKFTHNSLNVTGLIFYE